MSRTILDYEILIETELRKTSESQNKMLVDQWNGQIVLLRGKCKCDIM
jgi:hypothetical protein